jgi:acetyl-CoA carboxylase biotin carboxyl carrier protein
VPTPIRSPLTGRVWKIERAVGDAVAAGDPVIILESMKMEVPVEAPVAGTLATLTCAEGDAVEEGAILATLA